MGLLGDDKKYWGQNGLMGGLTPRGLMNHQPMQQPPTTHYPQTNLQDVGMNMSKAYEQQEVEPQYWQNQQKQIDEWEAGYPVANQLKEYGVDGRSSKQLNSLHPELKFKMYQLKKRAFDEHGLELIMIDGGRSKAAQDKAVKEGKSKASFGKSAHNHNVGMDFGFAGGGDYLYRTGSQSKNKGDFKKVGRIANELGLGWGGDKGVGIPFDVGHLEPEGFDWRNYSLGKSPETIYGDQPDRASSVSGKRTVVKPDRAKNLGLPEKY
jgi:hypothetical protein